MNRLFYSLISLIVALFFLMLGLMCVMLPWSPSAQTDLIFLILDYSVLIAWFGLSLILIGLSIIIPVTLNARHNYYHLRTGPRSVKIDESIIQSYLDSYWRQLFPHSEVPHRFTLKRNKIHLTADLPYIPADEQKELLLQIKEELEGMLRTFLGVQQPLSLSASFQPEPKLK